MIILSIETSCDDTGISILEAKGGAKSPSFKVLANNVSSQIALHIPYGGVFPALAKREHIKNLPVILEKTLKEAKLGRSQPQVFSSDKAVKSKSEQNPGIDLITVTSGPGLEIALWTGIVFAKELAKKWKVPVIPVNHMEGHIISVFAKGKGKFILPKIKNPALALLVSGGHTELVLMKSWMDYEIIGETLDDAVGEAFDKVARILGLPYPGGPQISLLAEKARKDKLRITNYELGIKLPRPMLHSKNFNFSFSGLKTAVLYLVRDLGGLEKISEETKSKIAMEFENAAIESLVYKTQKAVEKHKIKTLIVAGGVSANKYLANEMKKIAKTSKTKLLFPARELTGDNSLMIGVTGYLNYIKNKKKVKNSNTIKATGNLRL